MDETVNQASSENNEVTLLDYVNIAAAHSRMIIFTSMAAVILTYFFLYIQPNVYKSTARIMPPEQNVTLSAQILEGLGGGSLMAGGGGGKGGLSGLLGIQSPGGKYASLMKCDTIFDHIIGRFNLMKLFNVHYLVDARGILAQKTQFTVNPNDSTISVDVTINSPELAAKMANAFVEELDLLLRDLVLQEAKGRLAFLEKEHSRAIENLTKAEESLRLFSEKNSVLQLDTQTKVALEYIARLRAEIDSSEVSIQVLRQQATPYNYDLIRMETEVKGLKEKLNNAESQYNNCVSDVCLTTKKAPGLALEYLRLYREAKFREALYQLFVKLVEIAKVDVVRDNAVIRVVDPAMPPEKKANKPKSPLAILCGILFFLMMTFIVFVREYLQHLSNDEDHVQRLALLKDYLRPWEDLLKGMKDIALFKKKS